MKCKLLLTMLVVVVCLPTVILGQTVIQVAAGADNIDNALFGAAAGDTLELITDGGVYNETFTTIIDIPVTIRAAAGLTNKPIWTCDGAGRLMTVSAKLTLDGIAFDGSLGDSLTADCIRTGPEAGLVLKVNNCLIQNFNDGVVGDEDGHGIKGGSEARLDTLIITNSRFEHMPGEHISFKDGVADSSHGPVKYTRIEHCTFWDGQNEAIYMEDNDNDSSTDPQPELLVNHVTIVGVGSKAIYPKEIDGAVIKNVISVNNLEYPARIYNTSSVAEYILFNNCPNDYISRQDGATVDYSRLLQNQEPYFADVETGDFAVAANSPAAKFGEGGVALGDSNNGTWDAADITRWEIVENIDWCGLVKDATTAGDTIMFVTDGGSYMSPKSNYIPSRELVLMAAPGLTNKPVLSTNDGGYIGKVNANIKVSGLAFNGLHAENGATSTFRMLYLNKDIGKVEIEDCDFYNIRGRGFDGAAKKVDTLIVNNCRFWDFLNEAMRVKDVPSQIQVAKITNSSFWNVKYGVYIADVGEELEVSHCTFLNMAERAVYAKEDTNGTVIRDNIFVSAKAAALKVYGTPVIEYNNFWDNTLDIDSQDTTLVFPVFNFVDDPVFKDTSAANVDLALEANNSPAVGAASDGSNLGDPRWGTWIATGVESEELTPNSFHLSQNYPNPFNPETTIEYVLPMKNFVKLTVYNLLGQKVTTLVNKEQIAGGHSISWNGTFENGAKAASGLYLYKIEAGDFIVTKKMLLLK